MQTVEMNETALQAYDALRRAGIPVQPHRFPAHYHNEAFLRSSPGFPTPRQNPSGRLEAALRRSYSDAFELYQAQLAGALIHLMFTYPVQFLRAMHVPEVRAIVEVASAFEWQQHITRINESATICASEA